MDDVLEVAEVVGKRLPDVVLEHPEPVGVPALLEPLRHATDVVVEHRHGDPV